MALHREKRKYKTKSGKVAYRSVMVAAQGQPQMRLRLKQGGPAKSGAPRKGAILGAVVGAIGGAAVGALGGAAYGTASAPAKLAGAMRPYVGPVGAVIPVQHASHRKDGATNTLRFVDTGPSYNPLHDADYMRQNASRVAGMTATHVARSSAVFGTAGAVAGAVSGATAGYVAGRAVAAVQNRRSRGLKSEGPPHAPTGLGPSPWVPWTQRPAATPAFKHRREDPIDTLIKMDRTHPRPKLR